MLLFFVKGLPEDAEPVLSQELQGAPQRSQQITQPRQQTGSGKGIWLQEYQKISEEKPS
jgi:hypothetical protein